MNALPRPVSAAIVVNCDTVALTRRLDCRSYDRCLNTAVAQSWTGFSCLECDAYEAISEAEQVRQGRRAASALRGWRVS